jgi:glucose-1-phosphate thymidylyltransferase
VILAHPEGGDGEPAGRAGQRHNGQLPPTSLLSVANRALLRHALDWLAASGVQSSVVVVPEPMARDAREAVGRERREIAIHWLERLPAETLGETLEAVAGFLEGEPFVLHFADSLARQGLRSLTDEAPRDRLDATVLVYDGAASESDDVIELRPRLERARRPFPVRQGAPAGVAVMGAGALEAIADLGPVGRRGIEDLAERLFAIGGTVRTCRVGDWWRFDGGAGALLEGNRFALEGLRPDVDRAQVANSDIQGPVDAHPSARIESSVVRGPVVIGPGAHVREAYVGPYTSIGENVVIEGAEIEHSIILAGASIRYLGGRLEASVVGRDAKIFRDFRLPRALRLQVGEGANVSLA